MPEKSSREFVFFLLIINLLPISVSGQNSNYPPVHKEYYHTPVFENDQIRVLNVSASTGDTTALHRHCNPILYLTISGATVGLKEPSGPWRNVELPTGWIGQDIYHSDSCFVHQFAVIGEESLQIVAIEALANAKPLPFSFEPVHREEGFTLFEIDIYMLQEITRYSIPIILVEPASENRVDVIHSDQLTKEAILEGKAYAVFFEDRNPTKGSE